MVVGIKCAIRVDVGVVKGDLWLYAKRASSCCVSYTLQFFTDL